MTRALLSREFGLSWAETGTLKLFEVAALIERMEEEHRQREAASEGSGGGSRRVRTTPRR